MEKIEVDFLTNEVKVIPLSAEEISDAVERTAAEQLAIANRPPTLEQRVAAIEAKLSGK